MRPKSSELFIRQASNKFNNKYNYDRVLYVNNHTEVIIACPIHGDVLQTPRNTLKVRTVVDSVPVLYIKL